MVERPLFQKILVGVDGSDSSKHALGRALRLAALTGASLHTCSRWKSIAPCPVLIVR